MMAECMTGTACQLVMMLPSQICYTRMAKCQDRQVRRDGLDGCHPVFSLYSRETRNVLWSFSYK